MNDVKYEKWDALYHFYKVRDGMLEVTHHVMCDANTG